MIEKTYINRLASSLPLFEKKSESLYNFRCVLCGDSQKDTKKKRAYLYERSGEFFFSCHNCGANHRFDTFLKNCNPFLYREYKLDKFGGKRAGDRETPVKLSSTKPKFIKQPKQTKMPGYVLRYLSSRKLPKKEFDFTEKFYEHINKIKPGSFNMKRMGKYDHPRLLLPLLDENGNMAGIQGRAMNDETPKYITIALTETGKGVYGLHKLDLGSTIYVLEGVPDAMMIDNGIAVLDCNYSRAAKLFNTDQLVIIPDMDTRNNHIMKSINKCIKANLAVCLLPADHNGKDLNELMVSGMTRDYIKQLVDRYTYRGVRASLEFKKWRKDIK